MRTTTLYTIGTALNRAQQAEVAVDVLVSGQWIRGCVSALDGHGLVLQGDDDEMWVIRMERIEAVRVRQASHLDRPQVEQQGEETTVHPMGSGDAFPMPPSPRGGDDAWTGWRASRD